MRYRKVLLVLLTVLGTSVSWWPLLAEPNLGLPVWVSLACAVGCTGLSIMLAPAIWPRFLLASSLGTFGGLWLGVLIWWPSDPITGAWVPYYVNTMTLAVILGALCAGLMMRRRSILNQVLRRAVWAAILVCVAFGPVTLALTPPLVRRRIAHNDRLATERFMYLKKAVETARAQPDGASKTCDGTALQRYYSGPPFTDTDWRRITGNYVKQDGYIFMIYCHEKAGYTIDARPATTAPGYGTRWMCADGAGEGGCRMDFRHKCLPCPK